MPAIAGPFDELFSSNKLNEDVKTFGLGSENADVKISSTSLFSLVALAEDGGVCHGGMICILSQYVEKPAAHARKRHYLKFRHFIDGFDIVL